MTATPSTNTITIQRSDIRDLLYAESTNASRTFVRQDGVSEHENVVIDEQAEDSLGGAFAEAFSKLGEKMHRFINGGSADNTAVTFNFKASVLPLGLADNIKMYIVDYMMARWLSNVRPDYQQQYAGRANFEMDDLLRKLYKKEPPV